MRHIFYGRTKCESGGEDPKLMASIKKQGLNCLYLRATHTRTKRVFIIMHAECEWGWLAGGGVGWWYKKVLQSGGGAWGGGWNNHMNNKTRRSCCKKAIFHWLRKQVSLQDAARKTHNSASKGQINLYSQNIFKRELLQTTPRDSASLPFSSSYSFFANKPGRPVIKRRIMETRLRRNSGARYHGDHQRKKGLGGGGGGGGTLFYFSLKKWRGDSTVWKNRVGWMERTRASPHSAQ